MASTDKHCAVLHCESEPSYGVEFFAFPQPNDPRYAIWIERTLQGSQWTPSSDSTVCSEHFLAADVLTTEAADDSGRTEKRLKYDALPSVFECLPESQRPEAAYVPRPDSPEIIYQAPKQQGSYVPSAAGDAMHAGVPAADAACLPTSSVDEDPHVCCVPGCPSRHHQGVVVRSVPTIRFHAFPTDTHLHWEWTKRVRCSVSWQPAPSSVVCSAHFSSTDYEVVSGMLYLKRTAIPRQLACVGVFMRRADSPGAFSRMCAICGCWRTKTQRHYKTAARLAFIPFPADPDEREKWNVLCTEVSSDADLFACENHFLITEITSRFQENGEEKFTVRCGAVPRVEPTLWLDSQSSSDNETSRAAAVHVSNTENYYERPSQVLAVSNTPTAPKLVVLFRNGTPVHNIQLRNMPGKLAVARSVESAVAATEVCCVPGCPVTALNAEKLGVFMFRFISRGNPLYATWINRIRCAITWVDEYPLAICSRHFLAEDFDPLTRVLLANALPSQLSCISAFHFSGLREGETDVTGIQTCVVCFAKRKPSSPNIKSSEQLKFFPLPADPVRWFLWCKFVSAQTTARNVTRSSLICENHFLPSDFDADGGALTVSAVPSCTSRLQPGIRHLAYIRTPILTVKTVNNISGVQPVDSVENAMSSSYQCCVSGCENDLRNNHDTSFKFVASHDHRYETWLERVRPDLDWIPDNGAKLCSDHFLPSQITFRESRGITNGFLNETALPSLLNGVSRWQPESSEGLKRFDYSCCMPGCENKRGRLGSKEVTFFKFVAARDPRYDTWLLRVRPSGAWIPDVHTRLCSAHFFPTQIKLRKNGKGRILPLLTSSALPSLVNGETKWEPSDMDLSRPKRPSRNTAPKNPSCKCCVLECGNMRGQQDVHFFRFPARDDPRYTIWLERVRPNDNWIPSSETKICSAHFLASQIERNSRVQKRGRYEWNALNCKALPSLLNGNCVWEPNELVDGELKQRGYRCCVSGCGNRPGFDGSKKVSLFKFVKPDDPRYETWLQRVRPESDWIPNGDTRICSEHFLPSQIKSQKGKRKIGMLSRMALPSRSDGKMVWEPAHFRPMTDEEMESNGMRRFQCSCCVPGCGNVRNTVGSKHVAFFAFVAPEEPRYHTWLRRLQYNSVWIPKKRTTVCSEHFLESEFGGRKLLRSTAVPNQLSCMTALCGFNESDMVSEKIGCVICGLFPLSTKRELKPSERLQFFRSPVGELKTKWIDFISTQAAPIDSGRLAESASWFVCENHFVSESFEPQTETMNEARCLLADAVPSVPFALETDYVDPQFMNKGDEAIPSDGAVAKKHKRKKEVDNSSIFNPNPSNYRCVVPGCPLSSSIASRSSSERVTFHIFPSRSSARYREWMERICCAVSWSPNRHERICHLHFLPGDFVEETSQGKQPRTRQTKKTAVPSRLECVEKFRSPRRMNTVQDGNSHTCCICGCWRSEEKGSHCQRSERLTFFPFPVDDDRREVWVKVCRESYPDFVLSDESVVCENHFRQDDLICVYEGKRTTKQILVSNAVPSVRNFAWSTSDYDKDISENYLLDASDVDMEERVDDDAVDDMTETDCEEAIDTHFEDVSSADEDPVLPPSAIKWQMPANNGLPEDDAGDSFMDAIHLMRELSPALPSSMNDESIQSLQPLPAVNGALMYCAECQVFLQTPCWLHSIAIPDEPVISLAMGSLPSVLYLDVCDDSPNGKAVFAKDIVPRHTVFGPLVAPFGAEEDASARYYAFSEAGVGSRRKQYHLESDYACNWMKYVRFANTMEDSNLLVFARGLEIVFVTSRMISSHEELRVWYSAQYTEMITDVKPFIPDLHRESEVIGVETDAVEFVDDGASLADSEGDEKTVENVSFQNLPVTILPAGTVPPLPETIHGDHQGYQTHTRKKRDRAWRDVTSCYLNRNICTECSTRFRRSEMLELHKYSHSQSESMATTSERPERQCPECQKEFPDFNELLHHVNNHGTKLVPCPVCSALCSTTTLNIHVKRYHPEAYETGKRIPREPCLDCRECGLRFTNAVLYRIHKHKHGIAENAEEVIPEKCPQCKAAFQNMDNLVEHVEEHGKSIRKCPVCEQWSGSLRSHMVYNHPGYPIPPVLHRLSAAELTAKRMKKRFLRLTCYECCLRFPTDLLCQLHKRKHGNAEFAENLPLPQKCPDCAELFNDLDQLVKHVDDHGRSIEKCPVCSRWFETLTTHIRRCHPAYCSQHGLRRKVLCTTTCAECGMRFPTSYLCQLHNIGHGKSEEIASAMEMPTMCPQCNELLEDLDELVEHVNLHGKVSQKCPVCGIWFGFLSIHMRRKHPDYPYLPDAQPVQPGKKMSARKNRIQRHSDVQQRTKTSTTLYRRLTCYECRLRFPTEQLHKFHKCRHNASDCAEWREKCPECDVPFDETERPLDHVDSHAKRVRKCHLCHRWCSKLTAHMRRCHPEYHGPLKIKRISNTTSATHTLPCPDCGLRFTTDLLHGIHEAKHGREEHVLKMTFPSKCPECGEAFEEQSTLVEHVDAHGKLSKQCSKCGLWFGHLRNHMKYCDPDDSKNLTCCDCGRRFQTDALYQLHKRKHNNQDDIEFPRKCPDCGATFEELVSLMDHVEQHGRCTQRCPVCHQWCSTVKEHMRRRHPASELDRCTARVRSLRKRLKPETVDATCYYCNICFPTVALCKLHIHKHGRKEYAERLQYPQECPECCEVYENLPKLVEHVEVHGNRAMRDESITEPETEACDDDAVSLESGFENGPLNSDDYSHKVHNCPECGKGFRLRIGLQAHLKACRRINKCVICSEIFHSQNDFDQHVAFHETSEGFLCGICLEKFQCYRLLVAHVEQHGSETPAGNKTKESDLAFKCLLCQNGFASSDELNKHVKCHEGRNGFACPVCIEKFPFYRLLSRHVANDHRPVDPSAEYLCTICNGAFAQLNELDMHLFAHDAELQFKCDQPQCGKRFISRKSLQGHVSAVHKKQKRKAVLH